MRGFSRKINLKNYGGEQFETIDIWVEDERSLEEIKKEVDDFAKKVIKGITKDTTDFKKEAVKEEEPIQETPYKKVYQAKGKSINIGDTPF